MTIYWLSLFLLKIKVTTCWPHFSLLRSQFASQFIYLLSYSFINLPVRENYLGTENFFKIRNVLQQELFSLQNQCTAHGRCDADIRIGTSHFILRQHLSILLPSVITLFTCKYLFKSKYCNHYVIVRYSTSFFVRGTVKKYVAGK